MEPETRILVLTDEPSGEEGRREVSANRTRVLSELAAAGVKVREDSGGKLLVIETTGDTDESLQQIGGVAIVSPDESIEDRVGELDAQDELFARALAIRLSPTYRELKSRQIPGETPEEQLLISGPCTPPEG